MIIFALDASGKIASVCVMQDGGVLYEQELNEGFTHSATLLSLAQTAFKQTALAPAQVSLFAVTAGPGSFTGLRIGLSLVKGLALPNNTPVTPVSTLWAYSLATQHEGTVLAALDARRSEVYWAAFSCGQSSGCLRLTQDAAGPVVGIPAAFSPPAGQPLLLVGDGAELCYNIFTSGQVAPAKHSVAHGAALAAAQLGLSAAVSPGEARPVYLRLSQAQRERAAREAKNTAMQGDHYYG
jgi:tRNA threonylcarbamoyladenosine biosynthesis protein TsaB